MVTPFARPGRFEGPALERFAAKIAWESPDGCWEWTAYRNARGYGVFGDRPGHTALAHRFAYETILGPVPAGLELDHLCRNRGCVNPDHLEAVTHLENVRRGRSGEHLRIRTHCPRGHAYAGENLIVRPDGQRHCRTCRRAASLAAHRRRSAA